MRNLAESGIYRGSWIVREVSIIDGGYHQCACLFLLSRAGKECLDMGQFIRLRLTNELYVLKKDRWGCAYDSDRITDMLNSWFNMQLYDVRSSRTAFSLPSKRMCFRSIFSRFLWNRHRLCMILMRKKSRRRWRH